MSVSHERPHSQEDPLSGIAELLAQERVRKNLKAALGIIEWDKNRMRLDGKTFETVGTFISPSAQLYEIARTDDDRRYAVWLYSLDTYNQAGRPIAPTMRECKAESGSSEGAIDLLLDTQGTAISLDASNPQVINIQSSSVQALEASQMLQQFGVAAPRR